jgi:hypothetical protein
MQNDCHELTSAELSTTNGCGSSYILARPFKIPRWVSNQFFRCCNRHDIIYQRESDTTSKHFADDELYNCMYYAAFHGPAWKRPFLTRLADITYWCLNTWLSRICFSVAAPQPQKKGNQS